MHTNGGVLLLQTKAHSIRDAFHSHPAIAFSLSSVFLLLTILCPLLLKALLYFWPLLVSTGICLTAFYLYFQSQNHARGELLLIKVGKAEHLVEIRVSGEAKFGVCSDHVKVDCFLVDKSQIMEGRALSTQESTSAWDLYPANQEARPTAGVIGRGSEVDDGVYDEDMGGASHIRTDDLAEGLWNCYFGSYSKWHYDQGSILMIRCR